MVPVRKRNWQGRLGFCYEQLSDWLRFSFNWNRGDWRLSTVGEGGTTRNWGLDIIEGPLCNKKKCLPAHRLDL